MTDLIKDLIESSKERIKTPITSSFIIAFIVYNWRPIFLLIFSKASIENKIIVINAEYCNIWALLVPFLIAIFYVVAVPYLMMFLERGSKIAITGRKNHKSEQILFDLDKEKEIASRKFEIAQIETGQKDITDLKSEIESYKNQIDTLNEQQKSQINKYNEIIEVYKSNEIDYKNLLNKIKHNDSETRDLNKDYEYLSILDRKYFIDFCQFYIFDIRKSFTVNDKKIKKFIDYNLVIKLGEQKYILTSEGERLYNHLL